MRLLLRILCVLVLVTAVTVGGGVYWLIHSYAGASFAVRQLVRLLDPQATDYRVKGTLADGMSIENLTLDGDAFFLSLSRLEVKVLVEQIYPIRIKSKGLSVFGMVLKLPEKETGTEAEAPDDWLVPDLDLPQLDPFFDLLTVDLPGFAMQNVQLHRGAETVLQLTSLQADIGLNKRILQFSDALLVLPELQVQGGISLNMATPGVVVSGQATKINTAGFWDAAELDGRMVAGDAGLRGELSGRLSPASMPPLGFESSWSLQNHQLVFALSELTQKGREGRLEARGRLSGSRHAPRMEATARMLDLDVSAEAGRPLAVSATVSTDFHGRQYRGSVDLTSRGDKLVTLALNGVFHGDFQQAEFTELDARWQDARVTGAVKTQWLPFLMVSPALEIRDFTPQALVPEVRGLINAHVSGRYELADGVPVIDAAVDLFDSRLQGVPLQGQARLGYADDKLQISALDIISEGIHLKAQGELHDRVDFQVQVEDLAMLSAASGGHLQATGWLQYRTAGVIGELTLTGASLIHDDLQLKQLSAHVGLQREQFAADLKAEYLIHGDTQWLDSLALTASGTPDEHDIQLGILAEQGSLVGRARGQWMDRLWRGTVTELETALAGKESWRLERPFAVRASAREAAVAPLMLTTETGQSLSLAGRYNVDAGEYQADLTWERLALSVLDRFMENNPLRGSTSGHLVLVQEQEQQSLMANVDLSADLEHDSISLQDMEGNVQLNWNHQGLDATMAFELEQGAQITGRLEAASGQLLRVPQEADFTLSCQRLPLPLINAWLPPDLMFEGLVNCAVDGIWRSAGAARLRGHMRVEGGRALWYDHEQAVEVDIARARIDVDWHDRLRAGVYLDYDFGQAAGHLEIPIAATWPLAGDGSTPVVARAELDFDEKGLLSSFFPQQIQYSRGRLTADLAVDGTLAEPRLSGSLQLEDAEAYLPAAGIRAGEVRMQAFLSDDRIQVRELHVASGAGAVTGQGSLNLKKWQLDNFEFSVEGDRFQLLDLPEMKVRVSPQLQIEGDLSLIRVRGDVYIPTVMVKDQKRRGSAVNSPDLIVVDRGTELSSPRKWRQDIDIQLHLGEQVLIDMGGLEARIGGSLRLYTDTNQNLAAQGVLQVERGRFSSYGVALDIERGDLYYAGGPITQPSLDILALRRVGSVRAGVRATGTPREPEVRLYSEPAMPDADVLAYIVLGRPLSAGGGDRDLLMTAAGALLSQGESIILQEKIKRTLGLDVLEFSAGGGDMSESVVTTGKYLTPDLYVSLGYSLFTNTNEIKVRYRLTPRLDVESVFGLESGADLFYRIDLE